MKINWVAVNYRFTLTWWFILGITLGALACRVYLIQDTSEVDELYICKKGIAYKSMGSDDNGVFVKTNLMCLGEE